MADFHARIHETLSDLGIDIEIKEEPVGEPMRTPFPENFEHASSDSEAVERFFRILDWTDSAFDEFSGWFSGKTSPVHLFWHSFDLAVTRFSGRRGAALEADPVTQEAYSHEVLSFGFWAGDDTIGDATYYFYTAPRAAGIARPAALDRRMGRVRLWLARRPSVRDGSHGARPTSLFARLPPVRLRGGRSPRRLGRDGLAVEMVPVTGAAAGAPRHGGGRVRRQPGAADGPT